MMVMEVETIRFVIMSMATAFSIYKYFERELKTKADKKDIDNVLKEVEKKVDKILYDKELDFIKKSIQENSVNLASKLEEVKEDMKIIKEYLLK